MTGQTDQYYQYTIGGEEHYATQREVELIRKNVSPFLINGTLDIIVRLIDTNKRQEELSLQEQEALTLYHYYASLQHAHEFQHGGGI